MKSKQSTIFYEVHAVTEDGHKNVALKELPRKQNSGNAATFTKNGNGLTNHILDLSQFKGKKVKTNDLNTLPDGGLALHGFSL